MNEDRTAIGYLRVSTIEQDTAKNEGDILSFANNKGIGPVEWVTEKRSGKTGWKKRKIAAVIDRLGRNDVIIVPELSRLGRSTLDVLQIISFCRKTPVLLKASF